MRFASAEAAARGYDPRIFNFADRIAHMDDGRIIDITEGSEQARRQMGAGARQTLEQSIIG